MAGAAARLAPSPGFLSTSAPGERLRSARMARHLTLRAVALETQRIATQFDNQEFCISLSRLSEIETCNRLPNLYRLCSLSMIYEIEMLTIIQWFVPELDRRAASGIEDCLFGFRNILSRYA